MTRGEADHAKELRIRSMRIALDLSDLDQQNALAIIGVVEELVRFLHRPPGANAPLEIMGRLPTARRVP